MLKIVKVRGRSMHPTLASGDYLICTKARLQKHLRSGFVVVVDHPRLGQIVKRIKSIEVNGLRLMGDGPESTHSDTIGDVPLCWVKARVRFIVSPNGLNRL